MSKKLTAYQPQKRNANRHTPRGMAGLERSIQQDGWIGAITVAADGETFDGSARLEVGAATGFDEAVVVESDGSRPVIVRRVDIPSADDPRAVRLGIAANRVAELNLEWDAETLAALSQEMDLSQLFNKDELDALLASVRQVEPGAGGDEFDVDGALVGECRVSPGDLWVIGGVHRLICGDSTDAATVARLMGGERAQGVFTSPPYDQQRTYEGGMAADWRGLVSGVCLAMLPHLGAGAQVFINLGLVYRDGRVVRYWDGLIADLEDAGWSLFGWYVWDKLNGRPGDQHGRLATAHEWILHFAREKMQPSKIVKTKGGKTGTTKRTVDGALVPFTQTAVAVQPYKIPDSVIRTPQHTDHEATAGHPAPFPLALPETFMQAYGADVWYEPFCGSGTSIIAAHRLGRRCYGVELSPRYCEVILRRAEAEGLTVEKSL